MFFKRSKQKSETDAISSVDDDIGDTDIRGANIGDAEILGRVKEVVAQHLRIKNLDTIQCQLVENQLIIKLPIACASESGELVAHIKQQVKGIASDLDFVVGQNIPMFATKTKLIPNIKNIICVASGKGGVGKSATAINLAYALKAQGARVGILDADIYGPSVPLMLGKVDASPSSPDNKHMLPIEANGLYSNSIGYLVKNDHASIWRGPMVSKALQQLLNETRWPLLDYLIVDMPPGTGDIQLTMAQHLPLTAAVVVTTPQDIATADAAKGIAMFEKLAIPVAGLIENMSSFVCPNCQHQSHIFDQGGGQSLAARYSVPVLAELPLEPLIRESCDSGANIIEQYPEHMISQRYLKAAQTLSTELVNRLAISDIARAENTRIEITQLDA